MIKRLMRWCGLLPPTLTREALALILEHEQEIGQRREIERLAAMYQPRVRAQRKTKGFRTCS